MRTKDFHVYRIRRRLRGTEYPTIILASGPARFEFDAESEDDNDVVISGHFTKMGDWYIHERKRR